MASVDGMTAQAMLAIAQGTVINGAVVGNNLILTLRSGETINAGHVRGAPGADGGTDEGFATWLRDATSNTRAALKDIYGQSERLVGWGRNCVIVSPNALIPSWPTQVCAELGLIERNFGYPEASFTSSTSFLNRLQAAVAHPAFDNDDVALVIIADASYNVRTWNNAGVTLDVTTPASTAFAYAKTNFPKARIICVPIFWPADPDAQTLGVTGGYQLVWPYAVSEVTAHIRNAAMANGVEVVEDSHTWLTGLTGVMMANDTAPVPNATGFQIIGRWVMAHLKGNRTRADSSWVNVWHLSASTVSPAEVGVPRFKCRREGWNVLYNGGLRTNDLAAAGPADLIQFPVGFRPAGYEQISLRRNGTSAHYPGEIHHSGLVRVWDGMPPGIDWLSSGSFTLY